MHRNCEYCNALFEVKKDQPNQRFCNTSCSAKWRNATYGNGKPSEEALKRRSEALKARWRDPEFRDNVVTRMKSSNPVYMPGVVEKANQTRLKNGSYHNNFRYGNGKISPYEKVIFDKLSDLGFYYNYPIPTQTARDAFPEKRYPTAYKPDFVNLKEKLCIEIDGHGHESHKEKQVDAKKEECLKFLGFTTIRFTHEEIDNGGFDTWLSSYLENH